MPNRLALETSPYLQQHADNPVDWYPWTEEALRQSRLLNKPILLSIGYSACHWCHVMAHESFEDEDVAAVMNRLFVNIKVDREERPDLDHIYQAAHAMLTQRGGGWPLTMFLSPDQTPFLGGTYFPRQARYNLPGMVQLLEYAAEIYRTRQKDIMAQNESLLRALNSMLPKAEELLISATPLNDARTELHRNFDPIYGGFGGAPKFLRQSELEFLSRHSASSSMVLYTLRKIAGGGIHDQLGGGFCRYSVDERWAIPHFEKMLYDNGLLLALYADASINDVSLSTVTEGIAGWAMREMQSPHGGFYSSLDADYEHEEGKFYLWTPAQAASLLSSEEYAVAAAHYGLDQPPNFENRYWNLLVSQSLEEIAKEHHLPPERVERLLACAKQKMFAARENRVRPGRDEKILVSWNALMIKGMARAGIVQNKPEWIDSAQRALDFIRTTMWREGRLLATYKDGKAHLNAYLDDHAFLLDALLELLQASFRASDLEFARMLADLLLEQFEDRQAGGFFFTSHDHEKLIHRAKPGHDNAMPSGNGIAAYALQRLGHLLGDVRYLEAAQRTLKLFYPALVKDPSGFASMLMALQEYLVPPQIVTLQGAPEACSTWRRQLLQHYLPCTMITASTISQEKPLQVCASVCQGVQCLPAIHDCNELMAVCQAYETMRP